MASGPGGCYGLMASLEALLAVPGVVGAVLSTEEGLPLAAQVQTNLDEEALAAAAAVMGQLGAKASADSELGSLRLVCLDASRLRFVAMPTPFGHLLVLADYCADIERVLTETHAASAELQEAARALEESLAV